MYWRSWALCLGQPLQGVDCVFGISDDTVPVIDQDVGIKVEPFSDQLELARIEPPAGYARRRAKRDGYHFRVVHARRPRQLDPDIVARAAALRDENNKRQPCPLGTKICHVEAR